MGTDANRLARLAGLAQLCAIAAGSFTDMAVRATLIVPGSGRETAHNIADYPWLYRLGTVSDLAMLCGEMLVVALLYALFRLSAPLLSRLAALVAATGIGLLGGGLILHLAPLVLMDGAPHPGIPVSEVQSLVRIALLLQGQVHGLSMLLLGLYALIVGLMAWRSGATPRWVATLAMTGGVIHILSRTAALLVPALFEALPSQMDLLPVVAEGAFAVWLLCFGVDQAALARSAMAMPATASTAPDAASPVQR